MKICTVPACNWSITAAFFPSCSDGKILIWDMVDDLRFPAKGFMLFSKKRLVGGRCLAFSPLERNLFVLGSETGALMRGVCPPVVQGAGANELKGKDGTWKPTAAKVIDALPTSAARGKVVAHVESYAASHSPPPQR